MAEAPTNPMALPEPERERALARFQVLRSHIEDGVPLARAAREAGVPPRTAQRWLARYREGGLAGLLDRPRTSRGRPRRLPDELVCFVEGLALRRPRPSAGTVHRRAVAVARNEPDGWVHQRQPATLRVGYEDIWLEPVQAAHERPVGLLCFTSLQGRKRTRSPGGVVNLSNGGEW